MTKVYYTYLHLNESGVFYVGCGKKRRPWNFNKRSDGWKQIASEGYSVMIVGEFLNKPEAWEHEKELIAYFKPSCNKSSGGFGGTGCIRTPEQREFLSGVLAGEKHPHHKLTIHQVNSILGDPRLHREIAECYGVSRGLITHIKARTTWRHI